MEEITLKNGVKMPMMGFGVLQLRYEAFCESCVREALRCGYRLVDTAAAYFNEEAVGKAVKESGIPRTEIFLTTKLWIQDAGYDQTRRAVELSLKRMQLDYLDLCLNSKIAPMVDQIELHPFHQQPAALNVLKEYQVQPQGWAPLCEGQKMIFQNRVLSAIGKKYGKTAAQVILRWNIQRGVAVIPGSSRKEHMEENMDIWDFELSDADGKAIEGLDLGNSEIVNHHSACTAKWLNEWKIHE